MVSVKTAIGAAVLVVGAGVASLPTLFSGSASADVFQSNSASVVADFDMTKPGRDGLPETCEITGTDEFDINNGNPRIQGKPMLRTQPACNDVEGFVEVEVTGGYFSGECDSDHENVPHGLPATIKFKVRAAGGTFGDTTSRNICIRPDTNNELNFTLLGAGEETGKVRSRVFLE